MTTANSLRKLGKVPARNRSNLLHALIAAAILLVGAATAAAQELGLQVAHSVRPATEEILVPLPEVDAADGLTLQQLERVALASKPSVQRAAALVGAWVQVGLAPNPSVG
jgi:hypothetical protein